MVKFRFQDLKIWQSAIEIANELFDIADDLDKRKFHRWAEQLRASGMSIDRGLFWRIPVCGNIRRDCHGTLWTKSADPIIDLRII
jgi:hypothetical protein